MAAVLEKVLENNIPLEVLLQWLTSDGETCVLCILSSLSQVEFAQFFVNFIHDQAAQILTECHSTSVTPSKPAAPSRRSLDSNESVTPRFNTPNFSTTPFQRTPLSTTSTDNVWTPYGQQQQPPSAQQRVSSGKRRGGQQPQRLSVFSPQDIAPERTRSLQSRFEGGNNGGGHRSRPQRTILADCIVPAVTKEGQHGRSLFADSSPAASSRKNSTKGRLSTNSVELSQKSTGSVGHPTGFNLESDADFPGMTNTQCGMKVITPSRRITPLLVSASPNTDKNSAFCHGPIVPAPAHAMPRSVWAKPKNVTPDDSEKQVDSFNACNFSITDILQKEGSKSNSVDSNDSHCPDHQTNNNNNKVETTPPPLLSLITTPQKSSFSRLLSCEPVRADLVSFASELQTFAQIFACLIEDNQVPNMVVELYFTIQLLTARSAVDRIAEDSSSNSGSKNYLTSVPNVVFFASQVLSHLQRLLATVFDQPTLRLLVGNQRLQEFAPQLVRDLQRLVTDKILQTVPLVYDGCTPLGGVVFQADTDNRSNFPSDRSFQLFKKQRDVFYELIREWEDKHMSSGWTVRQFQAEKIRSLVVACNDLSNYLHLVRLFVLQLIQMCRVDGSNITADDNELDGQSELKQLNPEKLKRLRERLITPSRVGGVCPPPAFQGSQEFFRDFIWVASNDVFNRHLSDTMMSKIVELSTASSHDTNCETDSSTSAADTHKELVQCVVTLRILGKFLGFVAFLPYKYIEPPVSTLSQIAVTTRTQCSPSVDILRHLTSSVEQRRVVLCVIWAVDYLSMMDPIAPRLDYYRRVFHVLANVHRECSKQLKLNGSHSALLVLMLIGWLFSLPIYPEGLFYEHQSTVTEGKESDTETISVDVLGGVVDQRLLYICCPFFGELRNVLLDFEMGVRSQGAGVRKITPIMAAQPPTASKTSQVDGEQLQLQLEENFFRLNPASLKRTVEFVVDRTASNWIKVFQANLLNEKLDVGKSLVRNELRETELKSPDAVENAKDGVLRRIAAHAVHLANSVAEECDKQYRNYIEVKCASLLPALLPEDTSRQLLVTASCVARRLSATKISNWISTNITAGYFEKQLKAELEKQIRRMASTPSSDNVTSHGSDGLTTLVPVDSVTPVESVCSLPVPVDHDENLPMPSGLLMMLKDVLKFLILRTDAADGDQLDTAIVAVSSVLTGRQDLLPTTVDVVATLTMDVAITTICYRPDLWTADRQRHLVELWQDLLRPTKLLRTVICPKTIVRLEQSADWKESWNKFRSLVEKLVETLLVTRTDVEMSLRSLVDRQLDFKPATMEHLLLFRDHLSNRSPPQQPPPMQLLTRCSSEPDACDHSSDVPQDSTQITESSSTAASSSTSQPLKLSTYAAEVDINELERRVDICGEHNSLRDMKHLEHLTRRLTVANEKL